MAGAPIHLHFSGIPYRYHLTLTGNHRMPLKYTHLFADWPHRMSVQRGN
jgi:hypothetical protein